MSLTPRHILHSNHRLLAPLQARTKSCRKNQNPMLQSSISGVIMLFIEKCVLGKCLWCPEKARLLNATIQKSLASSMRVQKYQDLRPKNSLDLINAVGKISHFQKKSPFQVPSRCDLRHFVVFPTRTWACKFQVPSLLATPLNFPPKCLFTFFWDLIPS